jgi:hypothetical protein
MGMSFSSGLTSITGSVTSIASKVSATVLGGAGAVLPNGTTTLGTVPANKVWRVLSVFLQNTVTGAVSPTYSIRLNNVIAIGIGQNLIATIGSAPMGSVTWDYAACPVLAAAQTVTLVGDADGRGAYSVVYVEEDA